MLLNEVLTEQVPFPGRSYVEVVQSVGTFRHRPDLFHPDLQDTIGCKLKSCIERSWNQDPTLRMSFRELTNDLDHLLRLAAEAVRVGSQVSTPHLLSKEIELSIATLAGWLNLSCHMAEMDALPLAHTLVTVKHVTSVHLLQKLLQHNSDFLAKELRIPAVHEASIYSALGIHRQPASASNSSDRPLTASNVQLKSLKSKQLCELFDHCCIHDLNEIVLQTKLNGKHYTPSSDVCILILLFVLFNSLIKACIWNMAWKVC